MNKELLRLLRNRDVSESINIITKINSEELDQTDDGGGTIFHYAILYNRNNRNEKMFDLLIEKMSVLGLCSRNINSEFKGKTVLHMLAEAAFEQTCIKYINKVGKDGINIIDGYGVTVLHYAAQSRLNEVCKLVIPMLTRQELEYKDNNGNLALHLAIKSELNEVAISLIPKISRAAIEHYNNHHYTPLQYAAKLGLLDVSIALVKQMSQKGIEYKFTGWAPSDDALALAVYEKHIEICKLLVSHMSISAIQNSQYENISTLDFVKSNSHSEADRKIGEIIEARIRGEDLALINCNQGVIPPKNNCEYE